MLDFLILVILVAIFFGISLTSAMHGIIIAFLVITGVSFLLLIISPFLAKLWVNITTPATKSKAVKQTPKQPAKKHPISSWMFFFVTSYLITFLLLVITGVSERLTNQKLYYLDFLLPVIPFIIVFGYSTIKKIIHKKAR